MYKSDSRNYLKVDLEAINGINRDGFGSSRSLPSSPSVGTMKHTNGIWTEKIKREKIMRERKLNSPPKVAPIIDISDDGLANSEQQPPMIVLSNRLPFVLKRNKEGGLVRQSR